MEIIPTLSIFLTSFYGMSAYLILWHMTKFSLYKALFIVGLIILASSGITLLQLLARAS